MVQRFLVFSALMVLLYAGCGPSSVEKANKLVGDGNVLLQRSNAVTEKADGLKVDLFGENLTKTAELAKYKSDNKEKFEAAAVSHREAAQLLASAAENYESAAKLTSDLRFNEYLATRSREFRLLSETYRANADFIEKFLAEVDERKVAGLVRDNDEIEKSAIKRAAELRESADQIVRDNPASFKNH